MVARNRVMMDGAVSFFELLMAIGGALSAVIGSYVHFRVNMSALTQKIEYLEKEIQEEKESNKENHCEMTKKVDKIFSMISEIKIMIAEKTK